MSSLSLLSRGTGQVIRKKQEKLEVHFDPEDYLNWTSPETHSRISQLLDNSQVVEGSWRLHLPKTYSTRTGALILYSEDLAKPSKRQKQCRKSPRKGTKSQTLHVELHTLRDLACAILAYDGKELQTDKKGIAWQPYLHFLSEPDFQTDRQMRPGYSAKRYLLKLSQTWDPSILQKLQNAGYIKDPLLLQEDSQDERKKQQDLSAVPPKYNLLHIFYSPCPYIQTGLGSSSQKQYENKDKLLENSEEKHVRGRARIPLRISVRKLSFHLRRQQTKETTRSQDTAYQGIPGERWEVVHQATKEEPDHSERPNLFVSYPTLANPIIDTSDLWCEQPHVTFYGGFFPGRKISYSVTQRHLKNAGGRESGTPSVDTSVFPPIHRGASSERGGVTKEHRKQVPEIFRLPQISENSPRAPWKKTTCSELSKELVVLPLLVRLGRKTQTKVKKLKGTCCNEPQPETDACNKDLTPLPNDLILESDHKREQEHVTSSRITDSSQVSFCLPPIGNQEYVLSRRKTRKTEVCAENSKYERECHKGTSLSSFIKCPDREIICPSVLGSIQTTDDPRKFGLVPDEEAREAEVPAETGMVSRSLPETSLDVQELDGKELSRTQQIGNRNGFKNEQNTTGIVSISVEFRKGNRQSQGGLSKNSNLLQNEEETGRFTLPQTQSLKQQIMDNFMQDTGKQLDNFPQSGSLLHLKPHLAHSLISGSEMESVPESGNAVNKLLDHGMEIKESTIMDLPSSEKEFRSEEDKMALPKKSNKHLKDSSLNTAANVLENKPMRRQKKHELVKTGVVSKVQKKSDKKDSRQRRKEFVVGKPSQKKAVEKTVEFSKEKPADVRRSETIEEPHQEEEEWGGDADLEQIDSFGDGEGEAGKEKEAGDDDDDDYDEEDLGGTSDQSRPPSMPLQEEHLLPLQEAPPSPEQTGHSSASQLNPTNNKPIVPHPVVPIANGYQNDAIHNRGVLEALPQNKEEERLSREKIIAERAEKRRLAVERKRREQEEQKRKAQEQEERMERMKEEMQQEQQKRIEEIRLRKQQLEEERRRQEEEAERMRQAEKAAQERIRQQQEEHRRKLLEMQKKKQEEEQERAGAILSLEAEKCRQKEREIQLEEERQRLAEMAEEQRLEYEKKKQEEEEKMRREAEERRKRVEEEARIALEEARKHALLLARQREELEKQQQLQYKLLVEASGLERGQNISRPWVYSYFQHSFLKVGDDD